MIDISPATLEFLLSTGLCLGLLASAILTIASLPWSDREISQVDATAHALLATPLRRVRDFSRQAMARS